MKVLVVGTGGALGGSGITAMADQMTKTLAEMGHEPVRLIAGERRRTQPNRLNLENVAAVITEAVAVARAARRDRVDVVWLHTFGVPTLPAMRTLLQVVAVRAVGRPIIVELHAFDLAGHVFPPARTLRWTLRLVARMSVQVVVLHQGDASALERLIPAERIVVISNWVAVPRTPTPFPPGPPFTVVFVGALTSRKGVPPLIDAMRLLEDLPVRLRLVGTFGDEGPSVTRAIQDSGEDLVRTGSVTFVGPLDAEGVRRELRQAHLLVLPSLAEGTPMALLEAMAEGRPVLVTEAGNMAELVRSSDCGDVLASRDPAAIAAGIRDAFSSRSRLARKGDHGLALAEEALSAAERALTVVLSNACAVRETRRGYRSSGFGAKTQK